MSRIIAGAAGGLRLTSVTHQGTRPTTDRVKEAIFSRLESHGLLSGAEVLDLYAGSGALGLEALSRGAVSADLVEAHGQTARVCQQNAATVTARVPGTRARVHQRKVEAYVAGMGHAVDLVFADPPYEVPNEAVADVLEDLTRHLAPGAVIVLERGKRSGAPILPTGLRVDAAKNYGETVVFYLELEDADEVRE